MTMARLPTVLRVSFVVAALAVSALLVSACGGETDKSIALEETSAEANYSYMIPAGAGEAFDRGEPLEILPADLEASVGEVIEIVNEDDRGHLVGPFFVGANETLRQRFASPGEFIGQCTVHPSGELTLTIVD